MTRLSSVLLLMGGIAWLTSCGSSQAKKFPVTGTVTIDGQPLADGSLKFVSEGDFDSLEIKDGKFSGQVREGEHKVEIYAFRQAKNSTATEMYGADAEPSKENYLPAKYNTNSTEKKTVTAAGTNEFKFEVSAK